MKKSKALQIHSSEHIRAGRHLKKEEIIRFLDDFQRVAAGDEGKRKLISLRVPERLLELFKRKAEATSIPYQTRLIGLMREWVKGEDEPAHSRTSRK